MGPHVIPSRSVPRSIPVGMQRMQPHMSAYGLSQPGMSGGRNPGSIPMQRGVAAQAHQQQQVCFVQLKMYLDILFCLFSDACFIFW